MTTEPEFKKITLAFGKVANAQDFARKMEDYGYTRAPIAWRTQNSLVLVFKREQEREIMAIAREYKGYTPPAGRPLWPPIVGSGQ